MVIVSFYALSGALCEDVNMILDHSEIRSRIVTYISENRDNLAGANFTYEQFFVGLYHSDAPVLEKDGMWINDFRKLDFNEYITKMKTLYEYGDLICIAAAAELFQVKINMYNQLTDTWYAVEPYGINPTCELYIANRNNIHFYWASALEYTDGIE
jgi:hypothetical protein